MTSKASNKARRTDRKTDRVDAHIGARLRQRRTALNYSLDQMAMQVGISPQQLQKYEAGINRVTASRLYRCSEALHVPVTHFFAGWPEHDHLPHRAEPEPVTPKMTRLSVDEVEELIARLSAKENQAVRRKLIELMIELAGVMQPRLSHERE